MDNRLTSQLTSRQAPFPSHRSQKQLGYRSSPPLPPHVRQALQPFPYKTSSNQIFHKTAPHPWCFEDTILTMSKVSLFSLIFGLMLLGILFFATGFLVALSTLKPVQPVLQTTTWSQMNSQQRSPQKSSPYAQIMRRQAGQEFGRGLRVATEPLTKVAPVLSPFMQQAQSQFNKAVTNGSYQPPSLPMPPPPPQHPQPAH